MLPPGSHVGILGGGQLARMLSMAGSRLGFHMHVFDPIPDAPAVEVSSSTTVASYDDEISLKRFASEVDVITFEFENIPVETINFLASHCPVFPNCKSLEISQDRFKEKVFLQSLGLHTAPYALIKTNEGFVEAINKIGIPSVLKTCRFGYDGKGQKLIKDRKELIEYNQLNGSIPYILESFIPFAKELSVIISRGQSGEVVCFDPVENIHRDGILRTSEVPAKISSNTNIEAILLAGKIVNELNYVGVMGVEFFVKKDNTLLVNEIAPRVHNSGHWTQNACLTDQFEQHIRAITGWPLGDGKRFADAKMINLIGYEIDKAVGYTNSAVHIYGKSEVRKNRKMGHINLLNPTSKKVRE